MDVLDDDVLAAAGALHLDFDDILNEVVDSPQTVVNNQKAAHNAVEEDGDDDDEEEEEGEGQEEDDDHGAFAEEAVARHPFYSKIVDAYYEVRVASEDIEEQRKADTKRSESLSKQADVTRRIPWGAMPELDSFLKGHVAKLEEYARELHYSMNQLPAPGERTPNQHAAGAGCTRTTPVKPTLVQTLLVETPRKRNATDDVGTDHCTDFANLSKEEMEELIMVRYKDKIRNLRDKMLINSCKTKSKLPPPAVAQLSSWWSEHRIWPYPDDATKAQLIESTGLTSKQVTNWFINHRKRHWYKLFPGGIQPNSEEEAIQMLLASKDAPACGASSTPAPAPASAGFSMPADVSGAASCPPPKKRRKKES